MSPFLSGALRNDKRNPKRKKKGWLYESLRFWLLWFIEVLVDFHFIIFSQTIFGVPKAQWHKFWPVKPVVQVLEAEFISTIVFHCPQPVIIIHLSVHYDLNAVERQVKQQVIIPSFTQYYSLHHLTLCMSISLMFSLHLSMSKIILLSDTPNAMSYFYLPYLKSSCLDFLRLPFGIASFTVCVLMS